MTILETLPTNINYEFFSNWKTPDIFKMFCDDKAVNGKYTALYVMQHRYQDTVCVEEYRDFLYRCNVHVCKPIQGASIKSRSIYYYKRRLESLGCYDYEDIMADKDQAVFDNCFGHPR